MPIDIKQIPLDELHDLISQLEQMRLVVSLRRPRFNHYDYEKFDWSKRNIELARQHNLSAVTICNWRKKLGHSPVRKYRYMEWDWLKPDAEIARENKLPVRIVQCYRQKLGKPFAERSTRLLRPDPAPISPRYEVDWEKLNWKRADVNIAREIGCTRELVRQKRAQLGIEKFSWCMEKYEDFLKVANGRKEMHYTELNGLAISKITFARYCTKAGIKRFNLRSRQLENPLYKLMNWNLPNKTLTSIWVIQGKRNAVACHRCNFLKPKAAFRLTFKTPMPEEFHRLVAEEKKKAEAYFSSNPTLPP